MLSEKLGLAKVPPLPRAIIDGWQPRSPVDCLVLSPNLELLGRQPVNDLFSQLQARKQGGTLDQGDIFSAYKTFLTASQNGNQPGLDTDVPAAPDVPQLLIEVLTNEEFRVNGNGPLTREEARLRALSIKEGVRAMRVQLEADPRAVTQDHFDATAKLLHEEWRVFDGIPIAHFWTTGMNTGYRPE